MMPSASNNTKLEKQVSGTPAESSCDNNNVANPMKQAIITIEHKIRNLEKRKTRLETYRSIQASGKELSADQKAAVAKYDAVTQTLEFARDLSKQMVQFSKDAEKEQKKQARKDAIVKAQTETNKIREVLVIQNILSSLSVDEIREAFVNGENGAVKLDPADLDHLEKFNTDIQTRRPELLDDVPFLNLAQKAAEYLSMTIDGRPKQYRETTFENIKRIFQLIQESGFLDKVHCVEQSQVVDEPSGMIEDPPASVQPDEEQEVNEEIEEKNTAIDQKPLQQQQDEPLEMTQTVPMYDNNPPVVNNIYVMDPNDSTQVYTSQQVHNRMQTPSSPPAGVGSTQLPQHNTQHQQQPQPTSQTSRQVVPSPSNMPQAPVATIPSATTAAVAPVPTHFSATTVRAVEEAYFKQQQYIQQMRPLAEVIGGGNFFFLQDSELDSPDVGTATTYTNPMEVQTHGTNVFNQHTPQPPPPQQQPQHQMQMVPSPVVQQSAPIPHQQHQQQHDLSKGSHVNLAAPIPTQTFTNQSFPPLVQAPTALYPVATNSVATSVQSPLNCVPNEKQQIAQAVFSPQVNASNTLLSTQHQMIAASGHQTQIDQQQPPTPVVMMNRVPLTGYQQYESSPVTATVQVLNQPSIVQPQSNQFPEQVETCKDDSVLSNTDDVNTSPTTEWEPTEREEVRRNDSQTKPIESNQWSTEMNSAALFNSSSGGGAGNQSDSSSNANSNSRKNDWNDDNHHQGRHESNHWSSGNHQNDNYGSRPRHNNFNRNDQRGRDGGRSHNGMDRMDRGGGMRGGNGSGPGMGSNNGGGGSYRGRSNYTSQTQQNGGGRGGSVYFRSNDSGYYNNNQNGNSNSGGGNNNSGGSYSKDGGNNQRYDNSSYRSRGGNNNGNNSRNNPSSTNGTRPSMSSMSGGGMNGQRAGGGRSSGSSYVNSRQQSNPRQTQDVA